MNLLIGITFVFLACLTLQSSAKIDLLLGNATVSMYAPTLKFPNAPYRPPTAQEGLQVVSIPLIDSPVPTPAQLNASLGNIVYIGDPGTLDLKIWAPWVQNVCASGARLIVVPWGNLDHALGYVEFGYGVAITCVVPMVTVTVRNALMVHEYLNNTIGGQIFANVTGDDGETPFRIWLFSGWFWFLQIFLAAISCAVATVAVVKLISTKWNLRMVLHVNTICLSLEMLGALLRFLHWSIDPIGARQLTTAPLQSVARTCSIPFSISSTLFLSIYLHDTARQSSLRIADGGAHLRIPAVATSAIVFIVEIVLDAVYLIDPTVPSLARSWNALLYGFFCIALAIYYFFVSFKILQALNQLKMSNSSSQKRGFRLVSFGLVAAGFALFMFGILAFVALAPFYSGAPFGTVGSIIFWLVAHTLLNFKGIITIAMFKTPQTKTLASANLKIGRSEAIDSSLAALPGSTRNATDQALDSSSS